METESKIAELELRDAKARLRLRTVSSPIDGVVVSRNYSTGEYVTTEPVLQIARINPLKVEVISPMSLIGRVKPGDRAVIYPDQPIGGEVSGKVKIVDEVIDAASGTFGIRVSLPNDKFLIPAGINCQIKFMQGK
jgi:multidrug efflux pump subunit AcrA (membrane-fusion protein)